MKTYFECYPCFLRQSIEAAKYAGGSEAQIYEVIKAVLYVLQDIDTELNPAEIACLVHRAIRKTLGVKDPYIAQKKESTKRALMLYPGYKKLYGSANDFEKLIRLAIAGNILDYGVTGHFADLETTVNRVLSQPFAIYHGEKLHDLINSSSAILYLADNAGETVFDRLLIESFSVPVTYVVKGKPILNDATIEDAIDAGLDKCSRVIDNGSDAPGTVIGSCSESFRAEFESAEVVIAKGQANYESLSNAGKHVFCLLQAKCQVIAQDIGVPLNSIVLRQSD